MKLEYRAWEVRFEAFGRFDLSRDEYSTHTAVNKSKVAGF
jgi:hypothetical protein